MYYMVQFISSVLHIGPSALIKLCDIKDEPDLLRDLIYAQTFEQVYPCIHIHCKYLS